MIYFGKKSNLIFWQNVFLNIICGGCLNENVGRESKIQIYWTDWASIKKKKKILIVDPSSSLIYSGARRIWETSLRKTKWSMPAPQMDIQINRSYWDCDRMTQRHLSGLSHWADTDAEAAGSSPLSLSQSKSNTHHVQQTSISTAHNGSHAKWTERKTKEDSLLPGREINGTFQE